MKIVKKWEDGEFNVEIRVEFKTRGHVVSNNMFSARYVDCVNFEGIISNGDYVKSYYSDVAYANQHFERKFLKNIYVESIKDNYDLVLSNFKKKLQEEVGIKKESSLRYKNDKEITAGLPDSLNGM